MSNLPLPIWAGRSIALTDHFAKPAITYLRKPQGSINPTNAKCLKHLPSGNVNRDKLYKVKAKFIMQGKKCTQYKRNSSLLQLSTECVCGVLGGIFSALWFKPMKVQANLLIYVGWKLDSVSCWDPINLRNSWPEKVTRQHLKISYLTFFSPHIRSYKRSHQVIKERSPYQGVH